MTRAAEALVLGNVWTGDPARPRAEGVAIEEGVVVAVGDEAELAGRIGAGTRVTRFAGAVLPAFQDAHTHLVEGAMFDVRCNLHDLGVADALEAIRAHARALPAHRWVRGGGWSMDDVARTPVDRLALDRLVDGRPAYLTARDGHSAWVSTAALERADIDRSTPDPAGGRIERDADGQPTGILHETALRLVAAVLPETTDEEWAAAFELGQRYLHALGIVSWQDARIEPELMEAYLAAERAGRLKSRVALSLAWNPGRGIEQIDELVGMRSRLRGSRLSAPTVKVFVDGVLENRTAWLLDEYDDAPVRGEPLYRDDELAAIVRACAERGFGVHFHAVGDAGTRSALDACRAAASAERPGVRHQICHLQLVDPDDLRSFAELGVIANIQPLWACNDPQMLELCRPALGDDRYRRQYPFRSLLAAGARLACGSDWRVSTPDPLPQIEVAVTRRPPGDPAAPPLSPEEAIDLEAALAGFTSGAAYASGFETVSGTLAEGFSADLVALDGDPWRTPAGELGRLRVEATMFQGEWVYERPGSETSRA